MSTMRAVGWTVLLLFCFMYTESSTITNENRGELIFSHILWRHGDRSPTTFYPTNPYGDASHWPAAPGELTATGMVQHFRLGQWLRQRYDGNLLPRRYSSNDIYVRSTDYDRTLASAYSNLAGLYPPIGSQVWNKNLLWQPIPVHTVSGATDYVLAGDVPLCPLYQDALEAAAASNDIQDILQRHSEFIAYVTSNSGIVYNNTLEQLKQILVVHDNLFIAELYHKTLPDWTQSIYPSRALDELSLLNFKLASSTAKLAKFRMGYFLKDLLDRCASKVSGTLKPDRSLWIYSAHDSNLSAVLYGLGLFENQFVQYAAALIFELRMRDEVPYLEIFYRRTADSDDAEQLYIPGCGLDCPLDTMYLLYNEILPTEDFNTACQL